MFFIIILLVVIYLQLSNSIQFVKITLVIKILIFNVLRKYIQIYKYI